MIETAPPMTADEFARLARIIHAESGIFLAETKRNLLSGRINRRLRALGLRDYASYCDVLERTDMTDEKRKLVAAITTNVTAFFREAHHFDLLAQRILPPLVERARAGGRVRLWSAACSSGEEAYSMAMTVLDVFPDAADFDLRILATDIDPEIIAKARAGVYDEQLVQDLLGTRRAKYLAAEAGRYSIRPDVRALLRFAELNLHTTWPFSGSFDVIFCRNVVIYFDLPMRQVLWERFANILGRGGYLLIGHSERLDGPATARFTPVGTTAYQCIADHP